MGKVELPFSVTVHTEEPVILYCLRGLVFFCQGGKGKAESVAGTNDEEWLQNKKLMTFHFSDPVYQQRFIYEAGRILPYGSWALRKLDDKELPAYEPPKRKGKTEPVW